MSSFEYKDSLIKRECSKKGLRGRINANCIDCSLTLWLRVHGLNRYTVVLSPIAHYLMFDHYLGVNNVTA